MCGISGYINRRGKKEYSTCEISDMMDLQIHRGPDDQGVVGIDIENQLSYELEKNMEYNWAMDGMFGFDRLSILDLSTNGHQPMRSSDGKVIVVFNGEIYNAFDYRQELILDGVKLRSNSDTEILLNLYLKYGIDRLLPMLNGMFGICICDLRKQMMYLIRDRVGIKPLYYTITENRFAFASEIKSFLGLGDFGRELNEAAFMENISFYKPLENILFKNVAQVAPGQMLAVQLSDFQIRKIVYWDVNKYERPAEKINDINYWKKKTERKLSESVNRQKISDARLGCQLSGGVDSSLITYFASQLDKNNLNDSISVIFDGEDAEYSEEKYIDCVSRKADINAHKTVIDHDFFLKNYERTLWHADTVVGRPNSVGLLLLTKEAKKYVTVLLSGEGADEVLGGYFMFTQGKEVLKKLQEKKTVWVETVRNQPEEIHDFAEYVVISQQKTNSGLCEQLLPQYDSKSLIEQRIQFYKDLQGTEFDRQIKYAVKTYLPELLICQDKMSMANSIENRVPFLDNEFIDFAFSIPEQYLVAEKNGKYEGKLVLKEVCGDIFGEKFAYRRKMGFGLPYYKYFQHKRFREYFYDVILPGTRRRGIINSQTLESWYCNLKNKPWGETELFWKACSLEAWCQMFLEGRGIIEI